MALEQMRARLMQNTNLFPDLHLQGELDARYGSISGVPVGAWWATRRECYNSGAHSKIFGGICGTERMGASAIIMSSGYEDDSDEGEFFTYTGTGGQVDSFSGSNAQVADQTFSHRDNKTLQRSVETERSVRVIRGPNDRSKYAPASGYRYDGLYRVERAYLDKGKSGFMVCKYELRRLPEQEPLPVK